MLSRRKFLLGCAGALGLAVYGRFVEPSWFEVVTRRVKFFPGADGQPLRVLVLADLHYSSCVPLTVIARAVALGLAQQPDLILLAGDHVLFDTKLDDAAFTRTLAPLAGRALTFACFGNHDRAVGTLKNTRVRAMLEAAGARVLHNEARRVSVSGRELLLVGLGDLWNRQCLPGRAFPADDEGLPRLVLAHNPDSKTLLKNFRWELMVSGHTHGGQLRLPLIGAPFAPVKDKRYVAGLNAWDGRLIYTSRGVGNLHGVRFNCRPEVTLLELS
ncbi:MAG: phosphodiesterase YaeI [Verrucomicrobiales bacterium]|jgi:predicted MPP superfamily phosphohydrolase|nr:phosphodiesterase YaeI [Verrucomicrobiales bacterium]